LPSRGPETNHARPGSTQQLISAQDAPRLASGPLPRLAIEGITKAYGGNLVLDHVDLEVQPGQCHALAGYNGAGKSTLVHIIAGAQRADSGVIRLDGRPLQLHSPHDAQRAGISTIYQELSLVPSLSVAENIFLGDLPVRRFPKAVAWTHMRRKSQDYLAELHVDLDVASTVQSLSLAQRQMVELAKAMHRGARLILLDEPTAALSHHDTIRLFEVLRTLQGRGVSLLYISHKMDELQAICSQVTVLRDGVKVGTFPLPETSSNTVVDHMAGPGKSAGITAAYGSELAPRRTHPGAGEPVVSVKGLQVESVLEHIDFDLVRGEILTITGRAGSGQSAVGECLFGMRKQTAGTILIDGRAKRIQSPAEAIRLGIGLVPEERKSQGLVLTMSVLRNISLASLGRLTRVGFIMRRRERTRASEIHRQLKIKGTLDQPVGTLSGGNQQKVVFAKWLLKGAKILILVEPTRGVDVGAKAEIWNAIYALAARGAAVLVITSEVEDAVMGDRAIVLGRGRVVGEELLANLDMPREVLQGMAS